MNRFRSLQALVPGLVLILAACTGTPEATISETVGATISEERSQTESAAPSESAEASEDAGEEATVRLSQFAFDTEELTIAAGTEVSFVNADAAAHTVTEGTDGEAADDPIIDEELQQNGTASFTFDEPGTYQITCLFHAQMNMTVVVE
ncbi:MAG: plastocyanin/azurin family copper-binding protein [Candidatus Limnocylindria bacterium]